ncbi:hypothetical protein [Streptomyces acidiscabies]|uniref:hypothetical protein n=1 Tax=Streptomyces acidiscabies TaxID=42234 RepID=UPI00131D56D2|nr:hypothetical protein [Streptomyces acidiscabies]
MPEATGPEAAGSEVTGPEVTGPEVTGPEVTGARGGLRLRRPAPEDACATTLARAEEAEA